MKKLWCICFISIILSGCTTLSLMLISATAPSAPRSPVVQRFFDNAKLVQQSFPSNEMLEMANGRYSDEERYEIFIYSNQYRHPPAIHLAEPFAERSTDKTIQFLKIKLLNLKGDEDQLTMRDILVLLNEIKRLDKYNFSSDTELKLLVQYRACQIEKGWATIIRKFALELYPDTKCSK